MDSTSPPVTTAEPAALWFVDGAPVRMVWQGVRWRVSDTPTRLRTENEYFPPLITHPANWNMGWRFQAHNAQGESRMFDVVPEGTGWLVEHSFG